MVYGCFQYWKMMGIKYWELRGYEDMKFYLLVSITDFGNLILVVGCWEVDFLGILVRLGIEGIYF